MSLGFILKKFLNNDVENLASTVLKYILLRKECRSWFFLKDLHTLSSYIVLKLGSYYISFSYARDVKQHVV